MSKKGEAKYWASKASPKWKAQQQELREKSKNVSPEVKRLRHQIHRLIDPIWQGGLMPRAVVYKRLGQAAGDPNFHMRALFDMTTGVRVLDEATKIYNEAINKQITRKGRRR